MRGQGSFREHAKITDNLNPLPADGIGQIEFGHLISQRWIRRSL
jgi:hypothetical protein